METLPRHRFSSVQIKAVKPIISGAEANAEVLGAEITFHVDGISFNDAVHLTRQVELKLPVDITVATVQGELPVEIDDEGNVTVAQEVTDETASEAPGNDAQEPVSEDDGQGEGEGPPANEAVATSADPAPAEANPDSSESETEVGTVTWPPMETLVDNLAKAYVASDKSDVMMEAQFQSSIKEAAWHYGVEEKMFRTQVGDAVVVLEQPGRVTETEDPDENMRTAL